MKPALPLLFLSLLLAFSLSWMPLPRTAEAAAREEPPVLKVRGYGIRGNRELRRTAEMLDTREERVHYDAAFIEDAAFILLSVMKQDGYLYPSIRVRLALHDGSERNFTWREGADVVLERPIRAVSVQFIVEPGVLFYYRDVEISGLTVLDERSARAYFVPADFLLPLKGARKFTPSRLNAGISNLREVLVGKGYFNASVVAREVEIDRESGVVSVALQVSEGEKHVVGRLERRIRYDDRDEERVETQDDIGVEYTRRWVQDRTIELRNRFLEKGYADAQVTVATEKEPAVEGVVRVHLRFQVNTGPKIYLEGIVFRKVEKTRVSMLRHRVGARAGDELNRLQLERARYRLARLGVFDSVELDYDEVGPDRRRAIFTLREGKKIEANVLVGYGSYEMLRGGLEVTQYNVFGRAHRSRLRGVQSFKSTSIDHTYTIPEILHRDISAFTSISALRRREIDFLREEYGSSVGLHTYSDSLGSDLSLRYSYQMLESRRFENVEQYGMRRARVGSVGFDISRDRRDNPVSPHAGYRLNGSIESASRIFLGEANYQRLELASSLHHHIGRGLQVNAGLRHALIHTPGRVPTNLPFNKRFFPGGENSVRGYRYGEASPRDAEQRLIGAETYTLLNLEIEQMITPSWSAVLFWDGLAMAQSLGDYPYDETLHSLGGGVRYNTFMGPLRVEYGHNPSPRDGDPRGTLHVSLGFPF